MLYQNIQIFFLVHGYLGHIAQDIRDNNCYGFGQKGENALEESHHVFRLMRRSVSRTTDETSNKIDVTNRMYIRTNQIIRRRLALLNPKKRQKILEPTEDDQIVEGFFIQETNNQANQELEESFLEPIVDIEVMEDDDVEFVNDMDIEE